MNTKKKVYFFGDGKASYHVEIKNFPQSKGANLAEIINLGISVPSTSTALPETCVRNYANSGSSNIAFGLVCSDLYDLLNWTSTRFINETLDEASEVSPETMAIVYPKYFSETSVASTL